MITDCLKRALRKYGSIVTVTHGGRIKSVKAFIQPLRRRHRLYMNDKTGPAGRFDNSYKYYIGEQYLSEGDTVAMQNGEEFTVVISEEYLIADKPVYVWAILRPKNAQEDDYDDFDG